MRVPSGRTLGTMRAVLVVAGVLVVVLGALWLGQRRLIYLPDASAVPPASTVSTDAEDVTFTTADGLTLGAYLVRPAAGTTGASPCSSRPATAATGSVGCRWPGRLPPAG